MDSAKPKARLHKKGQRKFIPTDDNRLAVRTMAGCGIPQDRIRQAIINPHTGRPVSQSTLGIAFAAELEAGGAEMDALAAKSLRKQIESDNVASTIWYQKNRWGWKDRSDHVVGHLFGGSERNPDNDELKLLVAFGKNGEPAELDLKAYATAVEQTVQPRLNMLSLPVSWRS
jgi:hypothetical protein